MLRRPHGWIFLLGALLLLIAGAMVARLNRVDRPANAHQTLRLEQALAALEGGCLTCHQSLTDASSNTSPAFVARPLLASSERRFSPTDASWTHSAQAEVDAQLLAVGRRIEALPGNSTAARDNLTDAFLQAYADTRHAGSDEPAALSALLYRVEALDGWLRSLEHQASPYRMSRAQGHSLPSGQAALSAVPLSPVPAALQPYTPFSGMLAAGWALLDARIVAIVALAVVYASHRRGPPVAFAAYFSSVWSGRLPLFDRRSPFILPDHSVLDRWSA